MTATSDAFQALQAIIPQVTSLIAAYTNAAQATGGTPAITLTGLDAELQAALANFQLAADQQISDLQKQIAALQGQVASDQQQMSAQLAAQRSQALATTAGSSGGSPAGGFSTGATFLIALTAAAVGALAGWYFLTGASSHHVAEAGEERKKRRKLKRKSKRKAK